MLVPGAKQHTFDVAWCVGQPDLLYLITATDQARAQEIAITGLGDAQSTWTIEDDGNEVGLRYMTTDPAWMAYMDYAIGSNDGWYTTLANTPITPGFDTTTATGQCIDGDFSYADLAELSFAGIDLTGCDFSFANLSGASFSAATLTDANFEGATLDDVDLSGATLTGATFTGSNLSSVTWGSPVAAGGADFTDCAFGGPTVVAQLASAGFSGANFTGADLSGANLASADLSSATLYGANLTGSAPASPISSARLGGSGEHAAILSYAVMPNVVVDDANLQGVDFSFATINSAQTTSADAATAGELRQRLPRGGLVRLNLQGAVFDGACLVMVDFTDADLSAPVGGTSAASMVGACLQGATFTGAVLTQTNLANAAVSTAAGNIQTSYCDPALTTPWPLHYSQATALDAAVLTPTTVCPNGSTYAANLRMGVPLSAMLQAPGWPQPPPARSWAPVACLAPPPAS